MAPVNGVGLIFILDERELSDTALAIIQNSVDGVLACASSDFIGAPKHQEYFDGIISDVKILEPDPPEIRSEPLNRKELRARERGKDFHQVKSWENRDKPF